MEALKRYGIVCLILLSILPAPVKTQTSRADSLFKAANDALNKDPRQALAPAFTSYNYSRAAGLQLLELKSLYLICLVHWENSRTTEARKIAEIGLSTALKYHTDSLKGDFLVMIGLTYFYKSKYHLSLQKYAEALPFFKAEYRLKKIATTYLNMGICEKKLSRYEAANKYFFAAAGIQQKLNEQDELASTLNSIGNCFMELKWYNKAHTYFQKALKIAQTTQKDQLISQSLNNLGYACLETKKPDSAISYLKRSLYLKRNEHNTHGYILALQNLASAYILKNQYSQALPLFLMSVKISGEQDMIDEYLRGCIDVAELYIGQKDFTKALPYISKAEQTAAEIKSPSLLMKVLQLKAQIFENQDRYAEALHAERHANRLKDSLLNIKQNAAISKLEIQFQVREKNREIQNLNTRSNLDKKLLQQQRLSLIALGITLLLLIILLIVVIKSYRTKNADNKRIKNLMHEVHHRVKNNLQMLSGLFTIQLAESQDEAIKTSMRENEARLNSMNLIHQQLYGINAGTTINIKEYLAQLITHLDVTFSGREKNISMIADIEEHMIDADKAVPLGLIVNELVTNSFKYAFGPEGGTIRIKFRRIKGQKFELFVKDNGLGIQAHNKDTHSKGFGLRLVDMMTQQLHAVLETDRTEGYSCVIRF